MRAGAGGWLALSGVLALGTLAGAFAPPELLDWQPALIGHQPWRMLSAVAVHYSALHLGANLIGAALVAALGVAARVAMPMVWAWVAAWPLTHLALALRPDLLHYGGLSGVLHAGAAVVAVHLLGSGPGRRRLIGVALLAGLLVKVSSEAPFGPPLQHPAGWDIATAPFAHACGLAAGIACALVSLGWRRQHPDTATDV